MEHKRGRAAAWLRNVGRADRIGGGDSGEYVLSGRQSDLISSRECDSDLAEPI